MEFLRFGSNIPGSYHGCCAVCIIQDFSSHPNDKASIQIVDGDGGNPCYLPDGKSLAFAGPTYLDIFQQRLRIGTFSTRDMPDHAFFAILTENQVTYEETPWLPILKEAGFEFIRTVDNSVYTGNKVNDMKCSPHRNYIFGLFRNIGNGAVKNPFEPPQAWVDLKGVIPEAWEYIEGRDITTNVKDTNAQQLAYWNKHSPTRLMSEKEIIAAGAPVIMAGLRSKFPPQSKSVRETQLALDKIPGTAEMSPFGQPLYSA